MNANELREKAKRLHDILANIEAMSLEADDIFSLLSTGDSKHLELNIPILIQGLSKSKLEAVAKILLAIAEHAYVK
jgi:hypothetical protein